MLRRKMWRDVLENKAAYIACVVVAAIGLMVFVSVSMVLENLDAAKSNFYRENRFADGFAHVQGIPPAEAERLGRVEGVAQVDGRLIHDVRVLMPGRDENIFLRLVSLDTARENRLNDVTLLDGDPLNDLSNAVLLAEDFFTANDLAFHDTLTVILNGRMVELRVRGVGQGPDFVYALRTSQDIYPTPETFGIAYMRQDVMQSLFASNLFNEISFSLEPGYEFSDVEGTMRSRLERYGLRSLYGREHQVSDVILTQELDQMRSMVTTLPLLFLFVAAVVLYIQLKRMVEQQRGQIGTLKAFGYSDGELLRHFLSYAMVIGVLAGALGGLAGIWLSYPFTELYKMFFSLPGLDSRFSLQHLQNGILLSILFSGLAGYFGSREALRLQPAEAMRPPAPPAADKILLERWLLYWKLLTVQGKMATRNIFRSKQRSVFTLIGVAFAFSMIATTWYFNSIIDIMIVDQFVKVQRHDARVVFRTPQDEADARRELERLPGVKRVESVLEVPATLRNQWLEKDVVILGLPADAELYNILNDKDERVELPPDGILLASRLAKHLNAETGTVLEIDSPWAVKSPVTVTVAEAVPQYMGLNAFMEIEALSRLLGQGRIATAAHLAVEADAIPVITEKYRDSDVVALVEEQGIMLQTFNELMESFGSMIYILALFALITGFAVIYNASVVSLSERKRELASLRVLGMTPKEVLEILSYEQWFLSAFSILCGVPLTIMLFRGMASTADNDLFAIPVRFELFPFLVGAGGTILFVWVSQLLLARRIRALSMVEVLKERD